MNEKPSYRRTVTAGAALVYAGWIVGLVWRDENLSFVPLRGNLATDFCFYIPSPAVLLVCVVLAVRNAVSRVWVSVVLWTVLSAAPFYVVAAVENQWTRPQVAALGTKTFRFFHWNVFRANLGWSGTLREIRSHDFDVLVLSETPRELTADEIARQLGPDWEGAVVGSMSAFCRGEFRLGPTRTGGELELGLFECGPEGEAVRYLAVDILSNPFVKRRPHLDEVRRWLTEHRPDVTAGDFNTPRRAWGLDTPPRGFAHAYRAAGSGWSYTWPVFLPSYAIDQCIVGERVRPLGYEVGSSVRSDHRWQLLRFEVRSARGPDALRPDGPMARSTRSTRRASSRPADAEGVSGTDGSAPP